MAAGRGLVFLLVCLCPVSPELILDSPRNGSLPLCELIRPRDRLEEWLRLAPLTERKCNHTSPAEKTEQEKELYNEGTRAFAFDALASDRIGPHRELGYQAHPLCREQNYSSSLAASVIIIHHNEALSVLLRMLIGIFTRTSAESLKEVILYEDASEEPHQLSEPLKQAIAIQKWEDKVQMHRSDERQGLIRAKSIASRLATGDVLIFLDSHCEVTDDWLPPLLQPIEDNPKSVVVPVVDLINPGSFEYSKAMIAKSGFDWSLNFKWEYIPWDYFDDEKNHVRPFESPSMPGGLLAIRTKWFKELGEYDEGMEIWGAENVELSLKTWMCGGRVVVAPCSRIGHVFRMFRPYKSKPGVDTNLFNSLRVAKAWLGEYQKYFLEARPAAGKLEAGDVSYAETVRERLQCRDMAWYIENIYPQLRPPKHEEL